MKIKSWKSPLVIVVAIVPLALLALVVFYVTNRSGESDIHSYQACAEAGNPVQDSYPSVCVTPDGQRFVNPNEK